jgi:hypothetical protein
VGRIDFKLVVQRKRSRVAKRELVSVGHSANRFRKTFVSYAAQDRPEVLRRVQMLRPPLTDMEVPQELLTTLDDRDDPRLRQRIDESDVFLLFWSNNARRSARVREDVRYARGRQGPMGDMPPTILPVPIEGPPPPEPPPELEHLNFDDYFLYLMGSGRPADERFRKLLSKHPAHAGDLENLLKLSSSDDVPAALNKVRYITEKVLLGLCKRHAVTWGQAEPTVERMHGPLKAAGHIPKNVDLLVRTIQLHGSAGSHPQENDLSRTHLNIALDALAEFLEWPGAVA